MYFLFCLKSSLNYYKGNYFLKQKTEHDKIKVAAAIEHKQVGSLLGEPNLLFLNAEDTSFYGDKIDLTALSNPLGSINNKAYVFEVKTGKADHEAFAQVIKGVDILKQRAKTHSLWDEVKGVVIAESYTASLKKLLDENNITRIYVSFLNDRYNFFVRKPIKKNL